jgi:hypothetical protein
VYFGGVSLLDSALTLFRPVTPATIVKAEARLRASEMPTTVGPERGVIGVTGTANYNGLLLVEENANLTQTAGYGAPGGNQWGFWEHAALTNPACAMALDKVTAPIRDARYDFAEPKGKKVRPEIMDALRLAFLELLEPGIEEVAANAAWGFLASGFAINELVWAVHPSGLAYVAELPERLPSSLSSEAWKIQNGKLVGVEQQAPDDSGTGTWRNVVIPASKLLLFTRQRQGNNFYGRSVFRSVYFHVRLMEMLVKLIGITMQREGAGIPIAEVSDPTTKLDATARAKLEQFLANMTVHENASAVMPNGVSLKWLYSPGANKGHVVETYNALMLIVLQRVQAQQMVLGVNDTGSRAVGQIHVDASRQYVQEVVRTIEAVFNGVGSRAYTGVVRKFVDANFGPQEVYPRLAISLQKEELSIVDRLAGIKSGVDAGVLHISDSDEEMVREGLGLGPVDPELTNDVVLNGIQITSAATIVLQVSTGQIPRDAGIGMLVTFFHLTPEQANECLGDPGFEPPVPAQTFAPPTPGESKQPIAKARMIARELRPSERFLAVAEMTAFLDQAPVDFERAVRPVVVEMLVRSQPQIQERMADGDASDVGDVELDSKRLAVAVRKFLNRVALEGARQVRGELTRARASAVMRAAAGDEDGNETADPSDEGAWEQETSDLLDAQAKATVRRIEQRLRAELENEAIEVQRTGGDESEVVSRTVGRQVDSAAFKTDGRAIVTKAFNLGRDDAARVIGATEVERSAAMDKNTCGVCEGKDGETAEMNSPEHDALLPPDRDCEGGGLCRCVLVYRKDSGAEPEDDS